MDKQQFLDKWKIKNIDCITDLEAVIAHEIAKAKKAQPAEQPAPPMTYEERVKYIISNKLTHKKAGSDSWFAYKFYGYNIHFCDENGKDMIWVRFDELDLTEWYPYKKPFDRERFEAMFQAVVASGEFMTIVEEIEQTEYNLNKLDAYYAKKDKGGNTL